MSLQELKKIAVRLSWIFGFGVLGGVVLALVALIFAFWSPILGNILGGAFASGFLLVAFIGILWLPEQISISSLQEWAHELKG